MRDGAGAAVSLETLKREVCRAVDARSESLAAVSREIHAHPELAFEEHRAAALLVATLREAGLAVEAGATGSRPPSSRAAATRAPPSRCSPSTTRCPASATPAGTT